MSRPLRLEFPGALRHVTARGNAREAVFRDDADRGAFLRVLAEVVCRCVFVCHSYCLLGNHFHLLVETPRPNLGCGMQRLSSVFAQAFNRRHGRVGHVFQGRYSAILVEREAHLLEVSRYVVLNPVRAGLCGDPGDWRWSSYRATVGAVRPPAFLRVEAILARFGAERRLAESRYRAFVREGFDANPFLAVKGSLHLGSEAFAKDHSPGRPLPWVPRAHWRPVRPSLAELVRAHGGHAIAVAHRDYGYLLSEIASHLGVHPATVTRRLRRLEETGVLDRKL